MRESEERVSERDSESERFRESEERKRERMSE